MESVSVFPFLLLWLACNAWGYSFLSLLEKREKTHVLLLKRRARPAVHGFSIVVNTVNGDTRITHELAMRMPAYALV